MKIRTRLRTITAFSIVSVLLLGGLTAASLIKTSRLMRQKGLADQTVRKIIGLNVLTHDVLLGQSERPLRQWILTHQSVREHLVPAAFRGDEEQALVAEMVREHDGLRVLFSQLVDSQKKGQAAAPDDHAALRELSARLAGQLLLKSQVLISLAFRLSAASDRRILSAQRQAGALGWLLLALLLGTASAISILTMRNVAGPLARLHRGIQIMGTGNLEHRVGMDGNDEIAELSRDFDRMVGNLRRVTASRDTLEREIRERHMAERRLSLSLADLERSNRELEQFAYAASHDLQEPLRKIRAFSDRLKTHFINDLGKKGSEDLDRIINSARRMQELIDDLLTYSRVTRHTQPLQPVDLNEVFREVASDLETRIQETGGQVEAGLLPVLDADRVQMRQLFQNLVGNALKFHRDGVPPVVTVSATWGTNDAGVEEGACRLSVQDNGVGFDEKYLDRIFTMFERLETSRARSGTGMGLAICRRIVERHRGRITARSRPGEGACFLVWLPLRAAPEAATPAA